MSFVPTATISLLLLATAGQDLVEGVATVLWWVGATGHLALTVIVLSAWFGRPDITLSQVTPAWFIPIVGNAVTPLAAPTLGSLDLAWFAFSVGLVFWLGLLPLLLHRILLHEVPLPAKLLPTLAIFIAPPAVAMLSWQALTGETRDPVSRILHSVAVMFTLLLIAQVARLHTIPFAVTYWAYSFPLAAVATASIAMAAALESTVYDVLAVFLLGLTTLVVTVVGALTLRALARGTLLGPE
jgi:tellurite resistance protein